MKSIMKDAELAEDFCYIASILGYGAKFEAYWFQPRLSCLKIADGEIDHPKQHFLTSKGCTGAIALELIHLGC
ncbi:MAG: hypothetical protein ACFE0J_07935 [Elainellaceae cyanobacterium]